MKKGLKFSKELLEDLYLNQKLSLSQIGKKFDCESTNILYWMKKFKIKRRPSNYRKIDISKELLKKLYWDQNLSTMQIGKILNLDARLIRKKMDKLGIKKRTLSEAGRKKFRTPFNGSPIEKSFLLGLRAGDFYARKKDKSIRIQTSTTHQAQIDLLKNSFKDYGELRVYYYKKMHEWFIYVDLDESFSFLLEKLQEIPSWILDNKYNFYAFLASYMDSEGNWHLSKSHEIHSRFRFRLRSYDKIILEQMKNKLSLLGFSPLFFLEREKGYCGRLKHKFNEDTYNLTLNKKEDVLNLANILIKISKHSEKVRKMYLFIQHKNSKYKEVEKDWLKLKKEIKKEILKK